MNQFISKSHKQKQFILMVSLIGIAFMVMLGLLSIPVEYQLVALLYANQNLTPILELTVMALVASGIVALLLPGRKTPITPNRKKVVRMHFIQKLYGGLAALGISTLAVATTFVLTSIPIINMNHLMALWFIAALTGLSLWQFTAIDTRLTRKPKKIPSK